ncbi:putative cytochrome P450, partial [Aureobasidium melanogenum]
MLLGLVICLLFAPIILRLIHWINNYKEARGFGLPIVLIPVSYEDAWWLPLRPLFAWVQNLPFGLGNWYVYTEMGWPTVDGRRTSMRLGENFVLCSPTAIQIVTSHAAAILKTSHDHNDWAMPPAQSQIFAFFGPNLTSTHGPEWNRHRRITGPAFNERAMDQVWRVTTERVASLEVDKTYTLGGLRRTFDMVAMQILTTVGFGQEAELKKTHSGHQLSFMDSLGFILKHIILTALFNSLKAPDWILPSTLKRLKLSVSEFRVYMRELVRNETQSPIKGATLLSAMVSANEAAKGEVGEKQVQGRPKYLTEDELYGNLFVFNLAGYETTASALSFALPYIAAYPEVQQWMMEEVDKFYKQDSDYTGTFPKLARCLAWIYEVMRLASPAPCFARTPSASSQTLPIITSKGRTELLIRPGVQVGWNMYGGHLSPRWGPDALEFNPKRFIVEAPDGTESVEAPNDVLFYPWVGGPRVCPGKKFAQVEFVAMVANILSRYWVEPVAQGNESEFEARQRLLNVMNDKYFNISAHFKRPEDAAVRFVPRSGH